MDAYNRAMSAGPATRAEHVKPHNKNALSEIPRMLFVGKGGTLKMRGVDETEDRTWKVPAGAVIPFRAEYIRSTGTSAGDIMALY
jgi:hypothetical protein